MTTNDGFEVERKDGFKEGEIVGALELGDELGCALGFVEGDTV